jgi:hypothetical protein
VKRSLGRKAAALGAAVAATAATSLALLAPSPAYAASCVKVEPNDTLTRVKITNNCSYMVDLRVHWSHGPDSACNWFDPGESIWFQPYRQGAWYKYWIDCHGG